MNDIKQYFSDFFEVDEKIIESYGAINISLINDLPLFIDPFLLFNSEKVEYQQIHKEIINYLLFLQKQTEMYPMFDTGIFKSWYWFPEIKQTWIGFSLEGNSGRGLGRNFALGLHKGLQDIYKNFGRETITRSSHLEKLCLISPLVGRDKISDFTTNFAKKYLLEYTTIFASTYLSTEQCKKFIVTKVDFNYKTMSWVDKEYYLPCFKDDFVLLTPRDMVTRDNTFINRPDMIRNLDNIAPSIEDAAVRFELNNYFTEVLTRKNKEMPKKEKDKVAEALIIKYPLLIDYYIKVKEEKEADATSISEKVVSEAKKFFNENTQKLTLKLNSNTDFYNLNGDSYEEAYNRVSYLKNVIEDMDGYRLFYIDGKPIKRESDLQIMYRLLWYASDYDVNREVNNGRGPVDFKISHGSKDAALVEFKLASNSKLKNNLAKQVEVYQKANNCDKAIKVILYFTTEEYEKVIKILNELKLQNCEDIVLINAIGNKASASNVVMD
ncbi:MAG TPA: hypothetical protein VJ916_00955 [Anaerovoracaceae bacterium]|nr:hypothetical protein [Anaerovoracaceae bacterium]